MGTIETDTGAEPPAAPPAGATRGTHLESGTGGGGQTEAPASNTDGSEERGRYAPSKGTPDMSGTATGGSGTTTGPATGGGSATATGSGGTTAGTTTGDGASGTTTGGGGTTAGATTGGAGGGGTATGGGGTTAGAMTGGAGGSGNTTGDGGTTGGRGVTSPGPATGGTAGGPSRATEQETSTGGSGAASGSTAQTPPAGTAEPQATGAARPENLEQEVARLREEVQRLEREVDSLQRTNTGTGGSGTEAAAPRADTASTVLASVVMEGQVASVGKDHIVVRDAESGGTFNLLVTNTTRISANGKRVSPQQLSAGTPVQAAFNYIADGDTYATRIQAYPTTRR